MREKFGPVRPDVSKRSSSFNTAERSFLKQPPEWLNHRGLIALAIRLHPVLVIVAAEILEELEMFRE